MSAPEVRLESERAGQAPLVSIVVPAFNAAGTIGETIASVLRQTCGDWELVICNDASTDGTRDVVLGHADPRIVLLDNHANAGEGATRDRAIAAARGRWVAVLDADDAWMPERLQRLLAAAEGSDDAMVFDNIMVCHHAPAGLVPWRPIRPAGAFGSRDGVARDVPFADYVRSERLLIKPLIPREALLASGIRHSRRKFAADSEFFVRLGIAGLRYRYLPEALYLYRVTPGSATAAAKGAHLMRECLEECAAAPGLPAEFRAPLECKIAALHLHEKLYALAAAARAGRIGESLSLLVRHPFLFAYAPRFVWRHLRYRVHRQRHSGRGWDSPAKP